jgi:hypothetical protein
LVKKGEKYALLVDGKPFIMMGAKFLITGLSGSHGAHLAIIKAMNANMLQRPVYWDEIEPQQVAMASERASRRVTPDRVLASPGIYLRFVVRIESRDPYAPSNPSASLAARPS